MLCYVIIISVTEFIPNNLHSIHRQELSTAQHTVLILNIKYQHSQFTFSRNNNGYRLLLMALRTITTIVSFVSICYCAPCVRGTFLRPTSAEKQIITRVISLGMFLVPSQCYLLCLKGELRDKRWSIRESKNYF